MFISMEQIAKSLEALKTVHMFYMTTFLVCKRDRLPVAMAESGAISYPVSRREKDFLEQYFKPRADSECYYRVSRVGQKGKAWLDAKYPSSASQSTRTRGDLSQAFIHPKKTAFWAWHPDYVKTLRQKLEKDGTGKIPALHLAVWVLRDRDWPEGTDAKAIVRAFMKEFHITKDEREALLDTSIPQGVDASSLLRATPVTWSELRRITENPPDMPPDEGGTLSYLRLVGVGPAKELSFSPAERINLITGDNGLGKTFLLESAWWALSGDWTDTVARPRLDAGKGEPEIVFRIAGLSGESEDVTCSYDWLKQEWSSTGRRPTIPGLLLYARVDGGFAVWDPARAHGEMRPVGRGKDIGQFVLTRRDVWHGKKTNGGEEDVSLFNGLIADWVYWQSQPRDPRFETLMEVLKCLSPPGLAVGDLGPLEPGKPRRIAGDTRPMPTIKHAYGEEPLVDASAAVRRIVALAYLVVWAWDEHKTQSELIHEEPQRRMVVLVDEIEAHLHPQWQRSILPGLLRIHEHLKSDLQVQFLIATHSPLVMASAEPEFDEAKDKVWHLDLKRQGDTDGEVVLKELDFIRYGSADAWLTSEVFGMRQARTLGAERAIEDAKRLQLAREPERAAVKAVSERLQRYLAENDSFWPRWTYFAEQHGADL